MAASVVLAPQCSVHCRTTEDPWHDTVRSQRPETRDPRILIISIFLHIKLELENTLWHLSDGKKTRIAVTDVHLSGPMHGFSSYTCQ